MRIFVFEFITGGGLLREPLPDSLAREGNLMVQAVVRDLSELPGVEVLVSRDPRLPDLPGRAMALMPGGEGNPFALYARGVEAADAVWPMAPETGGVLEELSRMVLARRRRLLASHPDAIRIAGSKTATAECLAAAGIPVVPTYSDSSVIPPLPGPWVIKPDDGAGCADTHLVSGADAARRWLAARIDESFVAQPWIEGDARSLSLLCQNGEARLLCCNRQRVSIRDSRLALEGLSVNAIADDGAYAALAGRIAAALPGLWGYVGVDLVETAQGPRVLEINPRLTTSYCGLRDALGMNPAALVLGLLDEGGKTVLPAPPAHAVELEFDHHGP